MSAVDGARERGGPWAGAGTPGRGPVRGRRSPRTAAGHSAARGVLLAVQATGVRAGARPAVSRRSDVPGTLLFRGQPMGSPEREADCGERSCDVRVWLGDAARCEVRSEGFSSLACSSHGLTD